MNEEIKNLSAFVQDMTWNECVFFLTPHLDKYRFFMKGSGDKLSIDDIMTIEEFNWAFESGRFNGRIIMERD